MSTIKAIVPFSVGEDNKAVFENFLSGNATKKEDYFRDDGYFLSHVQAQLDNIKIYTLNRLQSVSLYVFSTYKGFLAFAYDIDVDSADEIVDECESRVELIDKLLKRGTYDPHSPHSRNSRDTQNSPHTPELPGDCAKAQNWESDTRKIIEDMAKRVTFCTKNCYWYFVLDKNDVAKSDSHFFKMLHLDEPNIEVSGKFANDENDLEEKFQLSKGNWGCISTKCMGVIFNRNAENNEPLERAMFAIYLLLQHEKMMFVEFKNIIISKGKLENKECAELKTRILECLSEYTFECISDNTICQNTYKRYKKVLGLAGMEDTMQELIFTLNDELDKKKENRMNVLTFAITILGLVSVVSSILEIISFFMGK